MQQFFDSGLSKVKAPEALMHTDNNQEPLMIKIDRVINLGKEQGYLISSEIEKFLSVDKDHLSVIIDMLENMNIKMFVNIPTKEDLISLLNTEKNPDVDEAVVVWASAQMG